MRTSVAALACLVAAIAAPAAAEDCKAIKDPTARLTCFDKAVAAPVIQPEKMTLVDFKTDKSSLRGRTVEVSGIIMNLGDNLLIAAELGDMNPVWVDVSKVSREQRRAVNQCNPSCKATVHGKVGSVMMEVGIIADRVVVQ